MGVVIAGAGGATREDAVSGALVIDGGLRFDSRKSQRLTRTPSTAGNRKTWTWSAWVKTVPGAFSASNHKNLFSVDGGSNDAARMHMFIGNASDKLQHDLHASSPRISSSVYRDVSGWYHVVVKFDSTQSTARNQIAWYINGQQIVNWDTESTLTQNNDFGINGAYLHAIGSNLAAGPGQFFDGLMSQVYLIDGQALDPSYFGYTDPLTNTWRPKKFKPQATPNNGTTWSSYLTTNAGSNFDGSYPVTNAFDNSSTTKCLTANNANGTTTGTSYIQFNSPSSFSGNLKVVCDNGNAVYNLTSGSPVLLATQSTGLDDQLLDCGTVAGISSIRVLMSGGSRPAIGAIYINGVGLIDSLNDTGGVGTNGFYLPMDGNTPIGQDQSGRGNNWTPVNFGGSNTIEKATGALPILNTDGGGKVARVGVRTDSNASSLVLALPLVGIKSDFSNRINSGTTEKVVTDGGITYPTTTSIFYGGSGFFNNTSTGDVGLTIPNSSDFNFGTGDFTIEFWIYNTVNTRRQWFLRTCGQDENASTGFLIEIGTDNQIYLQGSVGATFTAPPLNTWSHIAFTRSGTTLRSFVNGVLTTSATNSANITSSQSLFIGKNLTGYSFGCNMYLQDIRIYKGTAKYTQNFIPASTDPDILPDTPSGVAYSSNVALVPSTDGAVAFDGSGDYLSLADNADLDLGSSNFTIEGFVYVNATSASQQTFVAKGTGANNQASYHIALNTSGNWVYYLSSNGSTWDIVSAAVIGAYTPNAWQHIALVRSGNTFTPYLNGVAGTPTTSSATLFDSNKIFSIGADDPGNQLLFGFTSNVHVVKGTALYTSNFTPPTGPISSVANTKLLCCKSNSSATVYDVSPGTITANGNAAASNFNPFTVNINAQRGQETDWTTLSPLIPNGSTLSNGNLSSAGASAAWCKASSDFEYPSSGKWYWEGIITGTGAQSHGIGIAALTAATTVADLTTGTSYYAVVNNTGTTVNKVSNGTATSLGTIGSFVQGDIFGVAVDGATKNIWIHKNGIYFSGGDPASGSTPLLTGTGNLYPTVWGYNTSGKWDVNFGQKPFKFPPPAGFQPLALANTPRPTIVRPDQYVGIVTYTGTASVQPITGVGNFKPDFVWIKDRGVGWNHQLYDSVRGVGANKELTTSQTWREGDTTNMNTGAYGYVSSLDPSGFTLNPGSGGAGQYVNQSTKPYVAWCWKAGGNSNTFNINDIGYSTASAAGLTAGTITPTGASVNTKSGFSIITYNSIGTSGTVDQIPHGLGKAPAFYIVKNRDVTDNWWIYHSSISSPNNNYLNFTTAASTGSSQYFDSTSTIFGMRQGTVASASNQKIIAYLWAEIPGFSKFGSYTGNGSSDGPMVVTGFKVRWLMIKRTDSTSNWYIIDASRSPYNEVNDLLYAEQSLAETVDDGNNGIDFLSNGFKLRKGVGGTNVNASTLIYAAFAESPSFNLYGGQSNAR